MSSPLGEQLSSTTTGYAKVLTAKALHPPENNDKALAALETFLRGYGKVMSINADGYGKHSMQTFVDLLTPELLSRKITVSKDNAPPLDTHVLAHVLNMEHVDARYKQALLHIAAKSKMPQELRRQMADIRDENGVAPLAYALGARHYEAAKLFIESGAQLNDLQPIHTKHVQNTNPYVTYGNNNIFHIIADNGRPMPEEFVTFLQAENKKRPIAALLSGLNHKKDGEKKSPAHTPYHIVVATSPRLMEQFMRIDKGAGALKRGDMEVGHHTLDHIRGTTGYSGVGSTGATTGEVLSKALQQQFHFYPKKENEEGDIEQLIVSGRVATSTDKKGWYIDVLKLLSEHPDFMRHVDRKRENPGGYLLANALREYCMDEPKGAVPDFDKRLEEMYGLFLKVEKYAENTDRQQARQDFLNYALRSAAVVGDETLVRALIAKGAMDYEPPYQPHEFGKLGTAIQEAARRADGYTPLADLLLNAPAPLLKLPRGAVQANPANALATVSSKGETAFYTGIKKTYEAQHPGKKLRMTLNAAEEKSFITWELDGNFDLFKIVTKEDILACCNEENVQLIKEQYKKYEKELGKDFKEADKKTISAWILAKEQSFLPPTLTQATPPKDIAIAEDMLGSFSPVAPGGFRYAGNGKAML